MNFVRSTLNGMVGVVAIVYDEPTPSIDTLSVFVLYLLEMAIWCHPRFAKALPRPWLFPALSCKVRPAEVVVPMLKWDVPPSKLSTRPVSGQRRCEEG